MNYNRQSNIELLRIFLMIGVIILHMNNWNIGGGFNAVSANSGNGIVLYSYEALFICAVDAFVLITGFFMHSRLSIDFFKIILLIIKLSIFRVLIYIYHLYRGTEFSIKDLIKQILPADYFIILYVVLLMLAPFVNALFDYIGNNNSKKLLIIMISVFSGWAVLVGLINEIIGGVNNLSPVTARGDAGGYNIINFILLYSIGGYIGRRGLPRFRCMNILLLIIINTSLISFLMIQGTLHNKDIMAFNYDNPLIILNAVLLFLLFSNIKMGSVKIINTISKGCLGVYFLQYEGISKINVSALVSGKTIFVVFKIAISAMGIFIGCFLIDLIYRVIQNALVSLLDNKYEIKKKMSFKINL